jgi:UDP-GlcNAc:undecaprenyl-phosphate GlcNAc-1-phosphate transferase
VGIYLAVSFTALSLGLVNRNSIGLFLGGSFLFLFGLSDDKFHFTPYVKLFAQMVAGGIAIVCGVSVGLPVNSVFVIPITLLWIIGITNSFNLLDNIDGLAAGIAAISSLMLAASAYNPLAGYSLVLAGAALGFLPYNFNPARIFMGDSGSMFLGFSLAVISISGTGQHIHNLLAILIIPLLILCVPIFDTIFVMLIRPAQGKKIFEGGRDHTSHRLVTLGLSPRKAVFLLYCVSIIFGLIAILYTRLNVVFVSILAFLGFAILLYFGIYLFEGIDCLNKPGAEKKVPIAQNGLTMHTVFLHKRRIMEVLLDFLFICSSYYLSYFLRFEGSTLLEANLHVLSSSLVWVILIKMSCFFVSGVYGGVWRYAGLSDFFTVFKAVSLGSISSILFLTFRFRFQDYSRAVFFIDWLILLFLTLGSRFMFRILGEFLSRFQQRSGKKVLIFGAGDMGEMIVREIKRNKKLNLLPVAFIDDDLRKVGNRIHGIPVLGTRYDIKNIVNSKRVKEVIIAVASIGVNELNELIRICEECQISYRKVKGLLDV